MEKNELISLVKKNDKRNNLKIIVEIMRLYTYIDHLNGIIRKNESKEEWGKVISKKKYGDLYCKNDCDKCPLRPFKCGYARMGGLGTLNVFAKRLLEFFPELEPMRKYIETELSKEVKE